MSKLLNTDQFWFRPYISEKRKENKKELKQFWFRPDISKKKKANRKQLKALKKNTTLNTVIFNNIHSIGALWKLKVLPSKLISMLLFTTEITFEGFKKYLIKKDILFFKQLGRISQNLKTVIFEDTNLETSDVDQKLLIQAAVYLMKAAVHLDETYVGGSVESEVAEENVISIYEDSFEINDGGYLLMYKLLKANGMLNCLMNHNCKLSSNYILKLFGSVCERNIFHLKQLQNRYMSASLKSLSSFLFQTLVKK